jgi:hypothetical protein
MKATEANQASNREPGDREPPRKHSRLERAMTELAPTRTPAAWTAKPRTEDENMPARMTESGATR